jgi:hypothetical protein
MRVVITDWFRVLSLGVAAICGCHAIPSAPTDAGPLASQLASGQPTGQWDVAVDAEGTGTQTAPFGRIQDALDVARPGDAVVISGGTYRESIVTRRDDIRLVGAGDVTVTASGRVVDVGHSTSFENLAFDGQFGTRLTFVCPTRPLPIATAAFAMRTASSSTRSSPSPSTMCPERSNGRTSGISTAVL